MAIFTRKSNRLAPKKPKANIGIDPDDQTIEVNMVTGEKTKRAKTQRSEVNDAKKSKIIDTLALQKNQLERRLWLMEWSMQGGKIDPLTWLKTEKQLTHADAVAWMNHTPPPLWMRMMDHIQESAVKTMVTRHVDSVATLNDQHLMAAKLAMAKALEFMSKMTIETKIGKNGQPYFSSFRTADLKNCVDSIRTAQQISRTALGLPNDEGSIHVWQKIQNSVNINPPTLDDIPDTKAEVKEQALLLQKSYTYDDIKSLITAVKQMKANGPVIEAERVDNHGDQG